MAAEEESLTASPRRQHFGTFLGKVRVEDLRQMEWKLDDKKRAIRLLEAKTDVRRVGLEKREEFLHQCEAKTQSLIRRKEELEVYEAEISLREAEVEAISRKEKQVAAEELKISDSMQDVETTRGAIAHSERRFNRKTAAAGREHTMRRKCISQLNNFVIDLTNEVCSREADLAVKKQHHEELKELKERNEKRTAPTFDPVSIKAKLHTKVEALAMRSQNLKRQEIQWKERDKELKDKQTNIEKLKRELKWVEDSYHNQRNQLKVVQATCLAEDLHVAQAQAAVEKSALEFEKRKIIIELEQLNIKQDTVDLEQEARTITTNIQKLTALSTEQKVEMDRLETECNTVEGKLQELHTLEVQAVRFQKKLLHWARCLKSLQDEAEVLHHRVADSNTEIKAKIEEISFREAELHKQWAQGSTHCSSVSNEPPAAFDFVPSMLTVNFKKTQDIYLKGQKGAVTQIVKEDALCLLAAEYYRAMGRLQGVLAGDEKCCGLFPYQVDTLKEVLKRDRELKSTTETLRLLGSGGIDLDRLNTLLVLRQETLRRLLAHPWGAPSGGSALAVVSTTRPVTAQHHKAHPVPLKRPLTSQRLKGRGYQNVLQLCYLPDV